MYGQGGSELRQCRVCLQEEGSNVYIFVWSSFMDTAFEITLLFPEHGISAVGK